VIIAKKNGKEIKDCKPDYYARCFLFDELSRLEQVSKNTRLNQISPLFEGLEGVLASWILSARLERILEGTYSPNPGLTGQDKEEFLIFRVYFTKKHEFIDYLWKVIQNCLTWMNSEHPFDQPSTKQEFVEVCNRIRLSCQHHINSVLCNKNKLPFENEPEASLEWEYECRMKEEKIELLRDQLKLSQCEMEYTIESLRKQLKELQLKMEQNNTSCDNEVMEYSSSQGQDENNCLINTDVEYSRSRGEGENKYPSNTNHDEWP